MNEVFELTLRARNGQQRKQLQWFPAPVSRSELYERWRRRGIEVTDVSQII